MKTALIFLLLILSLFMINGCVVKTLKFGEGEDISLVAIQGQQEVRGDEACVLLGCPVETRYVGSKTSNKYHNCTCGWAENIARDNIICFLSKEETQSHNYVGCGVCKP